MSKGAIGIFDSGVGGLTVMKEIVSLLPKYDYIYLGDNARSPYGNRGFQTVYEYTLQCVFWFYEQGCPLVILACNTASAKALRTIQQNDLKKLDPSFRVLGVIRPTSEVIGKYSKSKKIGILATKGTVDSDSYPMEIEKFYPEIQVFQQACPMWVPLIENNEMASEGARYFYKKNVDELLAQSGEIDTVLFGCTHYPLVSEEVKSFFSKETTFLSQGKIVAESLQDYLKRHEDLELKISTNESRSFFTTDDANIFDQKAKLFYGKTIKSKHINLEDV